MCQRSAAACRELASRIADIREAAGRAVVDPVQWSLDLARLAAGVILHCEDQRSEGESATPH